MLTRRNLLAASLTGPSLCAASPIFAGQRLSQAALAEIAHCHSRWLAGEPDGAYADLRGVDLAEFCLDGIDLSYADLSGARLKGSYGHGFICLRGRLTGADLTGARLIAPTFDGAILDRARLTGAWLGDWPGPVAHPRFQIETDSRASLLSTRFNFADLSGARINAYLTGTSFLGANMSEADLSLCQGHAEFRQANLENAKLENCEFGALDLRGARLDGCSFNGTTASRGKALPPGIRIS